MSTKTIYKRIALVAVASLGAGVLSVAPANAAVPATAVPTATSTSISVAVGSVASTTIKMASPDLISDSFTLTAALVADSFPVDAATPAAATANTSTKFVLNSVGATSPFLVAGTTSASGKAVVADTSAGVITATGDVAGNSSSTDSIIGTFSFTPDKPGIYVFSLTSNASTPGVGKITVYAGYSANATYANKAFPTQGSNITTGWSGVAGGQATVRITGMAASTTYFVTADTGGIVSGTGSNPSGRVPVAATVTNTNGTNLSGGFNFVTSAGVTTSDYMDIKVTDTGSPATTTVSVKTVNPTTGAASTFAAATVTWGAAAVVSAQYSKVILNAGTANDGSVDTTSKTVTNAIGTQRFSIQIVLNDQYNVASTALKSVSASITGPGLIGMADTNNGAVIATGRSLSVTTLANLASVSIWGDGTSGTTVVTLSSGTVALGTKTVTFTGAATKATATQNNFVAKAATQLGRTPLTTYADITTFTATSTASNAAAFTVDVTDANDNAVTGSTYKIVSSDSTKIVAGTCAELTVGPDAAPGTWECSVSGAVAAASGASATVTFSVYSPATKLYDIVAAPLTFTVGGAMATLAVTLDKESYGAADRMILSAVAKDSSGNAAFDGQAPYQKIGSNKSVVTLPVPADTRIVNGKTATSATSATGLFAPVTSGSFTISGLTGGTATAPTGAAYSVTATVAADTATSDIAQAAADAAAEATDAANAATDAANAAAEAADAATAAAQDAADAVAALSTQVAELIGDLRKQITSLTNLVIKIQKKVKA
jgi:hypothetical protein